MVHSRLGYQAFLGIVLGIVAGLFFGPYCSILKPIGDLFIMLLQFIVIPYIPALLIHGVGSLTPELAKKLFKNSWPFLILMWALVIGVCYIVKVVIPVPLPSPAPAYSIERTSLVPESYGLLSPGNALYALFNNIVPGIVLFSVLFGLAVMHLKDKEPLLSFLDRLNITFDRVLKWVAHIAPIGIFAHIAHVMGTINFTDLAKLQLYILIVIGTTLFLSFWVIPVLTSCLTSIPLKELNREFRIVSFLPFATAISTLILPYISNSMRRLAERKNLLLGTFRSTSQTIIPIGFGFAQAGNIIPILFIFFLSFFYRHPFTDLQSLMMPFLMILFSVGAPQFSFLALPFILNIFHLPVDGFSIYAEVSAITLNFQVLLSATSMLSFMYLVTLKYYGLLEVHWKRLLYHSAIMIGALALFTFIGKSFFHTTDNYHNLYYNLSMKDAVETVPKVTVLTQRDPPPPASSNPTLARIIERKLIRVGYDPRIIPFCYYNLEHEVVGYDIAYAYELAKDLNVDLELVPLDYQTLISDLNSGYFDVAMSAIIMNEPRILELQFSTPYIEEENVLVLLNSKKHLFRSIDAIKANPALKIGGMGGYRAIVANYFPRNVYPVTDYDDLQEGKIDAMLGSDLPAYIWCLAHPEYTTTSFNYTLGKTYFAYPCGLQSDQFLHFLNEWLELKKQQGFELKQRQYWFLGKIKLPENERWSVIRNVLHWVK